MLIVVHSVLLSCRSILKYLIALQCSTFLHFILSTLTRKISLHIPYWGYVSSLSEVTTVKMEAFAGNEVAFL